MEVALEYTPDENKQIHTQNVCKPCDKVFTGKDKLAAHIYGAHTYNIQLCDICSTEFKNRVALKQHVRHVHANEMVKCKECDKEFKTGFRLNLHTKRNHTKSPDCICNLCHKKYKQDYSLGRHVKKYHSLNRPETRNYRTHTIKGKLNDSEGQYCKECDKTYTTRDAFNRHQTTSHAYQPTTCQVCQYSTQNLLNLRSHYTRRHQVRRDEARLLVPTPDEKAVKTVKTIKAFTGKRKTCNQCGKTYDYNYNTKHKKKCFGYAPTVMNKRVDPSIIENILERAVAIPWAESNQRKEQRRKRDEKVQLWKIMQNKLEKNEDTKNINAHKNTISETNAESNADEDPCKTIAESEKMVEAHVSTNRMQDSSQLFQANKETETETETVVESKFEGNMAEKIKMQGYPQSLNPLHSKEELAGQLGLSFMVYSKLTRDEILESLHEAILSEPANYEANNATDETDIDNMESTIPDLISQSKGPLSENDQMQKIVVKVDEFHSQTDIDRYIEVSSENQNNYTCNHCQKNYKKEANLEKHVQLQHELQNTGNPSTGQDTKYYSCNHCNDTFSAKRELRRHFAKKHRNQDDERKYICDICRASYKRQGNLDNHQQVYHGLEKDISLHSKVKLCSRCSKCFTGMQSLKCHIRRIHGNQEKVICSDCGKHFKEKNCLTNHVKNVHIVTNDQCGKCSKICKNKPALEKHMKWNHS